ncbi:MAG: proton-conducting transporter membrane subunit [Gemmatimonadota bacterium]
MEPIWTVLPLLAPLALGVVALLARWQPGPAPTAVLRVASVASGVGLVVAAATALGVALAGPATSPLLGLGGLGFALRLDALSATMLALVAFMGWVVLRYSRNYLDGDARHGTFVGRLALTVASVMLLVLSGNLAQLVVFWTATSFALHRLLLFYPDRRGAVVAARKKFIVARAGDLSLAVAAGILVWIFGTADLALLLDQAAAAGPALANAPGLGVATLLVVLSAALKSAQFPTHGWLIEVMETPTPVSALLHAGIINGGTFLVVRLGDVVLLTPTAMYLLIVVGGFTALFGSVVMVTQTSVKVSLAYSSAAHMGFMLLLCGLGAFPVAILHLVAHSFYKAHAFLASGSAIEALAMRTRAPSSVPSLGRILTGMAAAVATVATVSWALGVSVLDRPVALGLAAILAVGLTQLWTRGLEENAPGGLVLRRIGLQAAAVTLAFFGLELGAAWILDDAVPTEVAPDPTSLALMSLVVLAFCSVVLLQLRLPAVAASPTWARLRVHARNGFYANAVFDRIVGSLRVPASPFTLRSRP